MAKDKTCSPIEQALRDATKVQPKRDEDRNAYLSRLVTAVLALDDESWTALGDKNQDVANELITAKKNSKPYPDFPDAEPTSESADPEPEKKPEEADDASGNEKETDMAAKAAKKSGAKKKAVAKEKPVAKEKVAAPKKAAAPKKDGKIKIAWGLVLKNPKISIEDLTEKLKAKGFDVTGSTAAQARGAFLHVTRFLAENDANPKDIIAALDK